MTARANHKRHKKLTRYSVATIAAIGIVVLLQINGISQTKNNIQKGPPSEAETTPSRPMIILWSRFQEGPEVLRTFLSSGIFSHVMLANKHEFDNPMVNILKDTSLEKALAYCREKDVKIVWVRWLYPGFQLRDLKLEDFFTADYYINRIRNIRREAKQIGADMVALDAEPYASSPLNPLKTQVRNKLSRKDFEKMHSAIKKAIAVEGKVEFVLPGGSRFGDHIYDATRPLGKLSIGEHTYYDESWRQKAKIPYDIFGAYVNTSKENRKKPKLKFFTPQEILERQELWAHKKGLFIYPGSRENAARIAREFSKIRGTMPVADGNNKN